MVSLFMTGFLGSLNSVSSISSVMDSVSDLVKTLLLSDTSEKRKTVSKYHRAPGCDTRVVCYYVQGLMEAAGAGEAAAAAVTILYIYSAHAITACVSLSI